MYSFIDIFTYKYVLSIYSIPGSRGLQIGNTKRLPSGRSQSIHALSLSGTLPFQTALVSIVAHDYKLSGSRLHYLLAQRSEGQKPKRLWLGSFFGVSQD